MMTRLWIMSDLHLEAVAFPGAFRPAPPDFDVLVVAGDICEGDTDGALRKVRHLANDKPAVFVVSLR
jgi:3',5'-cyclic AMP phosphodiesterase CpdA